MKAWTDWIPELKATVFVALSWPYGNSLAFLDSCHGHTSLVFLLLTSYSKHIVLLSSFQNYKHKTTLNTNKITSVHSNNYIMTISQMTASAYKTYLGATQNEGVVR
jgi:hypothetical protein